MKPLQLYQCLGFSQIAKTTKGRFRVIHSTEQAIEKFQKNMKSKFTLGILLNFISDLIKYFTLR